MTLHFGRAVLTSGMWVYLFMFIPLSLYNMCLYCRHWAMRSLRMLPIR